MPTENFPSFDEALENSPVQFPKFEDALDAPPKRAAALPSTPEPEPVQQKKIEVPPGTPVLEAYNPTFTQELAQRTREGWEGFKEGLQPLFGYTDKQFEDEKREAARVLDDEKIRDMDLNQFLNRFPERRQNAMGLFPTLWDVAANFVQVGDDYSMRGGMSKGREVPTIAGITPMDIETVTGASRESTGAKIAAGVGTGLESVATMFATPLGVVTLGTGQLPVRAQQAIGVAFATDMAVHLPDQFRAIQDAIKNDDIESAFRYGTEGAASLLAIGHGAKMLTSSKRSLLSQRLAHEINASGVTGVPSHLLAEPMEFRERAPVTAERQRQDASPEGVRFRGDFETYPRGEPVPQLKRIPDDWRVAVQPEQVFEGEKVPGFVQIIDPNVKTERAVSPTVESLRAEGYEVPDFIQLPKGSYTVAQARQLLGGQDASSKRQVRVSESTQERQQTETTATQGQGPSPSGVLESWADQVIAEGQKRLSTGLDPELLTAYAVKGSVMLARGVKRGAEWTVEMVKQFGEGIRPFLDDIVNHIDSEEFKTRLYQPTERDVTRLGQASSVVAQLPGVKSLVERVTTTPEFERVGRNPFIRRYFIEPVARLRESEAALAEPVTTYRTLKADVKSTPEMVSNAAGQALRNAEQFLAARNRFSQRYASRRTEMVGELKEIVERRTSAVTARDVADAVFSYVKDRGRQEINDAIRNTRAELRKTTKDAARTNQLRTLLATDTARLVGLQRALGNSSAVKNVIEFASMRVDFSTLDKSLPDPLTTTPQFIEAMRAAAGPEMAKDKTFEQVVGAPMETIETVARVIMGSEPIRQRMADTRGVLEGSVEPFAQMRQAITEQVTAGDINKALRIMVSGVGKSAAQRQAAAKLARLLGAREQRLMESIIALDEAKRSIDEVAGSGEFRDMMTEVSDDIGAREVMVTSEGTTHKLKGIFEGQPDTVITYDPSRLNAEKTIESFTRYKDDALAYLSDPSAPGYDPARAAGLREYLRQYDWLVDTSILPQRGKFVPGLATAIPRTVFGLLGQIDQIPRFVLNYGAGFAANYAHRTLSAFSTAKEVTLAKYFDHLPRMQGSLSSALKAHNMTPDEYRRLIFNPFAASRQDFRNLGALKAGDSIGNGYQLRGEDVAYFKTLLDYEHAVIEKMNGVARENFTLIAESPSGVLYKDASGTSKYRLPFETGPNTTNRRAEKSVTWARQWPSMSEEQRINFINSNANELLFGYYADASNPGFAWSYKYGDEFRAILTEAKDGRPIESLDDLVLRTYDKYLDRSLEPTTTDAIQADILSEVSTLLRRIEDQHNQGVNASKVKIMAYGGENSFNTERGRQVIPSTWYDYGEITAADHAAFMNSALSKFAIEHLNSIESLDTVFKDVVTKFRDRATGDVKATDVQKSSRAAQLSGEEFFTWDQARTASQQTSEYLTKLRAALGFQKRASLIEANMDTAGQTVAQAVTTSLLSGPQANVMNTFGGAFNVVLFERAIRNQSLLKALGRTAWHEGTRMVREVVALLAHEGNPVGRRVYSLLRHAETVPLAGMVAKSLGRTIDGVRDLYSQGRRDAIILNKDLSATIASMLEFSSMGGVVESRPPASALGRAGKRVETRVRTATRRLGQATVGFVDARINATTFRLALEMQKDLENRAQRYLELRESAGADLVLSDAELVGGRLPDADTQQASLRLRSFLRDRAGINLDATLADYYARRKAEPAPGDARLFSEDQMRQVRLAMASWLNLADFSNRPVVSRTSRAFHNLSLFLGYPAHEMALLLSLGNRLSTRTWLRGRVESVPLILGMVAAAAVIGSLGQGTAERLKRIVLDKESTAPTIFNANDPARMRDAIISGFSGMVPFYGTILNNVTGNAFRNGFDLNSQIVLANVATDVLKTVKEIYQSGDGTVPLIKLSERYLFPANYLARFMPQYEGLREIANDRNLLVRNAKDSGLETLVRKPDGGAVTYTPSTPLLNEFANAVGAGDIGGAQVAFDKLVSLKASEGSEDPQGDALKSVQSRNPVSQVFVAKPSEQQLAKVLGNMAPEDRNRVQRTLDNFDLAIQTVGGNAVNFAQSEAVPAGIGGGVPAGAVGRSLRSVSVGGLGRIGRTRRLGRRVRSGRVRRPRRIRTRIGRTRRGPRIRRR